MKKLLIAASLFLFGGIAFLFSAAHINRTSEFGPYGTPIAFGILLAAFVVGVAGFLLFISWRDDCRSQRRGPAHRPESPRRGPAPPATGVYALREGVTYRVLKPFEDCYKNQFSAGETLTFQRRNFVPYHGGHTLVFAQRSIYLQEELNAAILNRFEEYLVPGDGAHQGE